jgi:acetyltransferase-like isoleucine patch superfamily enzyme
MNIIVKIMQYLKYKNIKFKSVGKNCNFKSLRSTFSKSHKITIGDNVWIGRMVVILPGVTIGKGAIIGAGAVVSKDIPDYAIAVGNPAKVVKYRNQDKFDELYNESEAFVYQKFGHKKEFKSK